MKTASREKFLQLRSELEEKDATEWKELTDLETALCEDNVKVSFHVWNDVWWDSKNQCFMRGEYTLQRLSRAFRRTFLKKVRELDLYDLASEAYFKEITAEASR